MRGFAMPGQFNSFLAVFLLCFGLFTPTLSAQSGRRLKDFRFEFTTGVSFQQSILDSSYFHEFSPPFLSGAYVSSADQTVYFKGRTSWGMNAALTYFPAEKFGLQFQFEYGRPRFEGNNSNYDLRMNYSLSDPAGAPPYPFLFERSYGWPDTEGNLNELCFSLNAVMRLPVSNTIVLNISLGPTYFRVTGEGVGLAYSKYWMEDDYFVGETFQLKIDFGPIHRLGLNVGGEFNWLLFHNVCLTADARFFACPEDEVALDILPNEMLTEPLDQVKTTMNIGRIKVNPTFYRVNLGLKYLF
jgi:hypothetical protein